MTEKAAHSLTRRAALGATGALVGSALASPALSQSRTNLRIGFGSENPALEAAGARLAQRVQIASGGTIRLTVGSAFGGTREFNAIGKASDGLLAFSSDWVETDPAFGLYCSCPFGLSAREFEAWVLHESGKWSWEALGEAHGIKGLLVGDVGPAPVMWSKTPIRSVADLAGKRVRSSGLGLQVLSGLGATAFNAEARRIGRQADMTESYGLAADLQARVPSGFSHLYTPSALKPHSAVTLSLDLPTWNALSESAKALIEACCHAEADAMMADSVAREMRAFADIKRSRVKIETLDQSVFDAIAKSAFETLEADMNARSKWADAWYDYRAFLEDVTSWTSIGESAFSIARARAMGLDA